MLCLKTEQAGHGGLGTGSELQLKRKELSFLVWPCSSALMLTGIQMVSDIDPCALLSLLKWKGKFILVTSQPRAGSKCWNMDGDMKWAVGVIYHSKPVSSKRKSVFLQLVPSELFPKMGAMVKLY